MANIPRTKDEILALFNTNQTGQISAQDLRDYVVTLMTNVRLLSEFNGDLEAAIAAIGSTETTLKINTKPDDLIVNATIPSTLSLDWRQGCELGGAFILTPNGSLGAGNYQLFDSNLVVDMSGSATPTKSEWFSTLEQAQEADAKHLIIGSAYSISATVEFDADDQTIEFTESGIITLTSDTTDGFLLSGDNIKVLRPNFIGPGTFHQDGTGSRFIKVTGDYCDVMNGKFFEQPGAAIEYSSATGGLIFGNYIEGGPAVYSATSHKGIDIGGCSGVLISKNRIFKSATGMTNQPIYVGSSSDEIIVSENNINECNDEGIYFDSVTIGKILNNIVYKPSQATGGGIRVDSSSIAYGNECIGNTIIEGRIRVKDAYYVTVNDNKIYGSTSDGINFIRSTSGKFIGNIVKNNTIIGFGTTDDVAGIRFTSTDLTEMSYNTIEGNIIRNGNSSFDTDGISATGTGITKLHNKVNGNIIESVGGNGIHWQEDVATSGYNEFKSNDIKNPSLNGGNRGIRATSIKAKYIDNIIVGDGVNLGIALELLTGSDNNTILGSDFSGYTTRPYELIGDVFGEQDTVYIGDIAAGTDEDHFVHLGSTPNGSWLTDCLLVDRAGITADGTDYRIFDLENNAGTVMSDIDTNTAGDNISLSANTAQPMNSVDAFTTSAEIAKDDKAVLAITHGGSGKALSSLKAVIRYITY